MQLSKKYQIGKRQVVIAYMDTDLKNSLPSTTNWLSKGIDACKKHTLMTKKSIPWSKTIPQKGTAQQLQTHNVPSEFVENIKGTN